jgi:hypothetical protein
MQTTTRRINRSNQDCHRDTVPHLQRAVRALKAALAAQQLPGALEGELEAAGQIREAITYVEAVVVMCQRYSELPE